MGANSTKANGLVVVGQFLSEGSALVDAVVCVVGIHGDSNIPINQAGTLIVFDGSVPDERRRHECAPADGGAWI